jgi:integrase
MSQEQFSSFITVASKEGEQGLLFIALGKAGLRPSEALALEITDVVFNVSVLNIMKAYTGGRVRQSTKTGIARKVDISSDLAAMLKAHVASLRVKCLEKGWQNDLLFPSNQGTYIDWNDAKRVFHRICRKAKIGHHRHYDLRNTFASVLLANGAPITYVAAQLGHTNPSTTLRFYSRWVPSSGKRYVDMMNSRPINLAISPVVEII